VLGEMDAAHQAGEEAMVTVLICGDASVGGAQLGGMVVRQVLDVSTGTLLDRDEASFEMGIELVLVKEKLTQVHREFGVRAKAAWQEVA
jgi:two-component system chemotaxis sensor kinase CheA